MALKQAKVLSDSCVMTQVIHNYRVLYRKDVEFAYLVILYKDILGEPRTPPSILYGFRVEHGSAIMKKDNAPTLVKNIFGNMVYQRYVDRGWKDISQVENLIPWSIKSWLKHQMDQRS